MTPAHREALLAAANTWRMVAEAATNTTRIMHAIGARTDRVMAGVHIAEAATALAAGLEELARDAAPMPLPRSTREEH